MRLLNIPNLLTAGNFFCGMLSIILSLTGNVHLAAFPLIGSLFFDYLDGMVARLLHQQGELGKQMDSLADVVSFGVAPGIWLLVLLPSVINLDILTFDRQIITYRFYDWIYGLLEREHYNFWPFLGLLVPVFSMFRLAKFNIDTRQSTSFIGLPTPANTMFFSIYPIIIFQAQGGDKISLQLSEIFCNPYVMITFIMVFSYLLIAELPLFSLKFKNLSWKENQIRFIFLLLTLVLIITFKMFSMPIIIVLYLIVSLVDNKIIKRNNV